MFKHKSFDPKVILEDHFDGQVYDIIDKFTDLANESLGDYIKSEFNFKDIYEMI
jgi:hypothetical protein